jgi:hypothetical protein
MRRRFCVGRSCGCRCRLGRVEAELGAQQFELVSFEVADRDPAPAVGSSDHGGKHELHRRAFIAEAADDLGAAAFLDERPLRQVRGADRMRCRTGTRWIASSASRSSAKQGTAAGNAPR